jgi:precorrin-8X/cobalt-precorrin-8 methylmutase
MSNDMRQMTGLGRSIEDSSFAVIDSEAGAHEFDARQWQVVRRVIHATADFEFKTLMKLTPDAIESGIRALVGGCPIVCDVKMIIAGLSDEDVIADAKAHNSTRAIEAMKKAHKKGLIDGAVIAVGNAPTALIETARLVMEAGARPALIIGVPVGFVSAAESKEAVLATPAPSIVARGRKGGSTIAVAIIHALLLLSTEAKA